MEILRTPDERFEHLSGYPFEPHYTIIKTDDGSDLRIHHIDEGPKDGPILLAMHMTNIIADRVLGLHQDPRVHKGVAFRDIPTGGH